MQSFLLRHLTPMLFWIGFSLSLGAQTAVPVLDSVSKGTFPLYIWMKWKYDFKKYPQKEITFVVERKMLVNPAKGTFGKISRKGHQGSVLEDKTDLKPQTWYAYKVKAVFKGKESDWSNEDYGFLKDFKQVSTAILYEPQEAYQLAWSAVQGATAYRLQIIEQKPGQLYNQDPETGFYNVPLPLLKDTILKRTQYTWTGQQKAILWSVQAINGQEKSYFPYPLHADSMVQYGGAAQRDNLFQRVTLNRKQNIISFSVYNPTKNPLKDVNVGIYLSKQNTFDFNEAVLAKNLSIYLPPQKRIGFQETLRMTGYQFIHLVPVQSGVILKADVESIPIF